MYYTRSPGADRRNRTADLHFTKVLLYQLSYIGKPEKKYNKNRLFKAASWFFGGLDRISENLRFSSFLRCSTRYQASMNLDLRFSYAEPQVCDSYPAKTQHEKRATRSDSLFMAGSTGFEPAISSVTGRHVRPLHHEPMVLNGLIVTIYREKSNWRLSRNEHRFLLGFWLSEHLYEPICFAG